MNRIIIHVIEVLDYVTVFAYQLFIQDADAVTIALLFYLSENILIIIIIRYVQYNINVFLKFIFLVGIIVKHF